MSKPDIQRFEQDGTWRKPPGAVRVDITVKAADGEPGGPATATIAMTVKDCVGTIGAGIVTRSFAAGELPDEVAVGVGQPGGYAEITTYLE